MKQYITYYRSFLHWLALLSLIETNSPHHGVPHAHSVLLRHGLTYRSDKNFVWFICTDHVLAPKITSHGAACYSGMSHICPHIFYFGHLGCQNLFPAQDCHTTFYLPTYFRHRPMRSQLVSTAPSTKHHYHLTHTLPTNCQPIVNQLSTLLNCIVSIWHILWLNCGLTPTCSLL